MKTQAWVPVGTSTNQEDVLISKGDVVQLVTGELVTFTEMKRVRFIGKINGKGISVPLYRNKYDTTPYILKVTGKKDNTVITKSTPVNKLKYGQLFALEGHKETFMFVGTELKRGTEKIVGIDLASGKRFTIGTGFTIVKINIPKVKRDYPVTA